MHLRRQLWGWIGLLACAALPCGATAPTLRPIAPDGRFEDWDTVLANPANTTADGSGSYGGCGWSADRDCLVGDEGSDLRNFAFSWDATNLYLHLRREAALGQVRYVLVFLDADRDRSLGPGERVMQIAWNGMKREVISEVFAWQGASPVPLRDAFGYADGFDPPISSGGFTSLGSTTCTGCGGADEMRFETSIPWTLLGVSPGAPLIFHVSSSTAKTLFPPYQDNCGGLNGAIGDLGFARLEADPGRELLGAPGGTLRFPHRLQNLGNLAVLPNLRGRSTTSLSLCFYADSNGDGLFTDLMGCDGNGDGLFSRPADGDVAPTPAWDLDANQVPDPGPLPGGDGLSAGSEFHYEVAVTIPANTRSIRTSVVLSAEWSASPSDSVGVTDIVHAGDLVLSLGPPLIVSPGAGPAFPHTAWNRTGGTLTAELALSPSGPFAVSLHADRGDGTPGPLLARDANGDGLYDLVSPGADSDGDGLPDTGPLADGATFGFVVVPESVPGPGTVTVDAFSTNPGGPSDSAVDEWETAPEFEILPAARTLDAGDGLVVTAGKPAFYGHRIRQSATIARRFVVDAVSGSGWRIRLFTDPDGDGNPSDGEALALPAVVGPLVPCGGSMDIALLVEPPPAALPGERDVTLLTVSPELDPGNALTASDETAVSKVVTTRDALHEIPARLFSPCTTVHLYTAGLLPLQPLGVYRVLWYDEAGTLRRATSLPTDGSGTSSDALPFPPDGMSGVWGIILQQWSGTEWIELDRQPFWLEREGRILSLRTDRVVYPPTGSPLQVDAVVGNLNRESGLEGAPLYIVVLSPGAICGVPGGTYLDAEGSFLPYTGVEATTVSPALATPARGSTPWSLAIPAVTYPETGTYAIHATWRDACGGPPLATTCGTAGTPFQVSATAGDLDGDGLADDEETGTTLTDPADADTDDDGLMDGEEFHATGTDPLAWDTDADTLPDGLERGIVTPGPGTDTARITFFPDLDPLTTTNPRAADTDGGGLGDGAEDENRNGRVDAGERDPNLPADDTCSLAVPPEVAGLRVARTGTDLVLSWQTALPDPCATYEVLWSGVPRPADLSDYAVLASGVAGSPVTSPDPCPTGDGALCTFLVRAVGALAGPGPVGHFGQ